MDPHTSRTPTPDAAAALTRSITSVLSARVGRGPTEARARFHDDTIALTLRDSHTKGERLLVEHGRHDLVDELRRAYLAVLQDAMTEAVEREVGRKVAGVLANHSAQLDLTTITVVLEPAPQPATSTTLRAVPRTVDDADPPADLTALPQQG